MRRSLHQDRQGTRRAEVTARPEHSGPAEPTDPDRHISGSRGFLFPPFHTPLFSHLIPPSSTTAAISAFLCRCGIAFSTNPLLQPLWATFSFSPPFHNGSNSRISLPLWHGLSHYSPTTDPLGHILLSPPFHNGSIFRDSLPLRHGLSTDPLLQAFREIVPPSKGEFLAAFPFH